MSMAGAGIQARTSGISLSDSSSIPLGANVQDEGVTFAVWAPLVATCSVLIVSPEEHTVEMMRAGDGYFVALIEKCPPGTEYYYLLDGSVCRPDPASRCQLRGVHGPSTIVPTVAAPPRTRTVPELSEYVIYEMHIGTFTAEGTFTAAIRHLDRLQELGITAVECMPVAEFPGGRNWGYDGVYPFAVEHRYGGADGMEQFVAECHKRGMAFILDVVYNHLGPEGNYLSGFGPYFTSRHETPWGNAFNFDGPHSDHVRRFFIENALYWIDRFGVDAFRLDAVHAIHDESAYPFLQELTDRVHARALQLGRPIYVIAESDQNDSRLVTPASQGGLGLDAQWADDLHHALHVLLTGERSGYYADFDGLEALATALRRGWTFSGQYSPVRQRRFGNSPDPLKPSQLVVCSQNHDQVGNRKLGERLLHLTDWETARLAAATVILSPYIPLLFMGEEYGDPAPFLYFVSHSDPDLQEAVRQGRQCEFAAWMNGECPPDPQSELTFEQSKLHQELHTVGEHAKLHAWYSMLLHLRRTHAALRRAEKRSVSVETPGPMVLLVRRSSPESDALILLNFATNPSGIEFFIPQGQWDVLLNSADEAWGGKGSDIRATIYSVGETMSWLLPPRSCIVFTGPGSDHHGSE